MRLRVSAIVRRRSTLDSSFLGRQGVGRGHPTRLTSRLMRGEKFTEFFRMNESQCANCATRKSTVRYEERHKGNGTFFARGGPRNPRPSTSDTPHTDHMRTFPVIL